MSQETNVEIFINKQLDAIQTQASGRSNEQKELRDACQDLKGMSAPQFSMIISHLSKAYFLFSLSLTLSMLLSICLRQQACSEAVNLAHQVAISPSLSQQRSQIR